jgi:hypothetical protein
MVCRKNEDGVRDFEGAKAPQQATKTDGPPHGARYTSGN